MRVNILIVGDEDGYLLLVKCSGALDCKDQCPLWQGKQVFVDPTAETTIALSHIEVILISTIFFRNVLWT